MTITQITRLKRNKKRINKSKLINKSTKFEVLKPQIKGITLKIFTMTPKKPNSALRKVAQVKINTKNKKNIVLAYIPGEKHSLSIHNLVLLRKGKTQDLPGLKYKIIRGVLDCKAPIRNKRRSLYSVPKNK